MTVLFNPASAVTAPSATEFDKRIDPGELVMAERSKRKAPTIQLEGTVPKLHLDMPLDERKIKAIQKCLEKGHLTITVSKVDLASGRIGDAWLYD